MKTRDTITIAIADQSVIVRSGLFTALKRLPKLNIQAIEISSRSSLEDCIRTQPIDILAINPYFEGYFDLDSIQDDQDTYKIKMIALSSTHTDPSQLRRYDAIITIFDSLAKIGDTIFQLIKQEEDQEDQETLTDREKEVVVCIVKGMTNKEIADHLFLSIHTINTHRKNITKKLQIHSASGLTIYAIVNKLVDINEINAD